MSIVLHDLSKKPMNQEIKQQWVAALRSGQYTQGSGCLRQFEADGQETFCCLGVLCDVYLKTTGIGRWQPINDEQKIFYAADDWNSATSLPESVRTWAGLSMTNPAIPFDGEESKISNAISLNDTYALSFEEIANLIEAGL